MRPCGLSHPLPSVCFEGKIQFSASRDLSLARSKRFQLPEAEAERPSDAWSAKPPDFSLKLYRSLLVPQRNERQRSERQRSGPQAAGTKRRAGMSLPRVLLERPERKEPAEFTTRHRPPGAPQTRLAGKSLSERYRNPKPHDFRPLDDDLPDIVTTYERDPGNLRLKLKHLDTMRTPRPAADLSSRDARTRMDTHKPAEPKWDSGLILPPPPWPPKSASYTRHRRRGGAYSAFLDRVEEKLSRSWKSRL